VLDLRDNNGGSGDLVVLICNHLLEPDLLLYTYSDRSGRPPGEMRTSPPERRFGRDVPAFVLTSGNTLSAAEALTFLLQDFDRAMVVGQRTPGMANPSRRFRVGDRFELTVPFLLIGYGESGTTYAGAGVAPDIEVPAESALDVALQQLDAR
jgi:C-terminal processing protease CtpA/Prc